MQEKLNTIKQRIEEIQTKSLVANDMKAFISLVLKVFHENKQELRNLTEEHLLVIKEAIQYLESQGKDNLGKLEDLTQKSTQENLEAIKLLKEEVSKSLNNAHKDLKDDLDTLKKEVSILDFSESAEETVSKINTSKTKIKVDIEYSWTGATQLDFRRSSGLYILERIRIPTFNSVLTNLNNCPRLRVLDIDWSHLTGLVTLSGFGDFGEIDIIAPNGQLNTSGFANSLNKKLGNITFGGTNAGRSAFTAVTNIEEVGDCNFPDSTRIDSFVNGATSLVKVGTVTVSSACTNMNSVCNGARNLQEIDFAGLSGITTVISSFANCGQLKGNQVHFPDGTTLKEGDEPREGWEWHDTFDKQFKDGEIIRVVDYYDNTIEIFFYKDDEEVSVMMKYGETWEDEDVEEEVSKHI